MCKNRKKPEILAPAGDLEKLKAAILYGADAVYVGGSAYSLRAKAQNFSKEEMKEGIVFAHKRGKKVFAAVNIFAHEEDFHGMGQYLQELQEAGADALIISDPGVFALAREVVPEMEIHISTQANNTNAGSALFWHKLGARRIVAARELSMTELKKMKDRFPEDLSLEAFVHGAMCISYSGRCLLSSYLTGRDANRGLCAHPCRWQYALAEEKRPGEWMPIEEDSRGTYIMNSKDLNMLPYLPALVDAGIDSFKIEGRMKSPFYVGTVVKAYREAIDDYFENPALYQEKINYYLTEVSKASHRAYTTAFYFNKPDEKDQIYGTSAYIREYDFVGLVIDYNEQTGLHKVEQKNKFSVGDYLETLAIEGSTQTGVVEGLWDEKGTPIEAAPHAQQVVFAKLPFQAKPHEMLRRKRLDAAGTTEG